jgi:hypothetical protein
MGQAGKIARRFASFFYVSMMSVCGLFGLLDGSPAVLYGLDNGAGRSRADARAASVLSADCRQRH